MMDSSLASSSAQGARLDQARHEIAILRAQVEYVGTSSLEVGVRVWAENVKTGRRTVTLNAHLVFVYDAGHVISTERPEAFTEVVVDFLERHEAFVISRAHTVIHP